METAVPELFLFLAVLSVIYPLMKLLRDPPKNQKLKTLLCIIPMLAAVVFSLLPARIFEEAHSLYDILSNLVSFLLFSATFVLLFTQFWYKEN